jgi:protein SCO1/2
MLWAFALPSFSFYKPKATYFDQDYLKIDEPKHLGTFVPDVNLILEDGSKVKLYELIAEKPNIIFLAYYTCNASCPIRTTNLIKALEPLKNRDFNVLVLSFDEKDTLKTLREYKQRYGQYPGNWIFALIDKEQIQRFTEAVGFKFFYSEVDNMFVHPNVYIFVSPDGRITRYIYGVSPKTQDLRIALAETETNKVTLSSIIDTALLVCFKYDPSRSTYVVNPVIFLGGIGFASFGALMLYIFLGKKFAKREV